MKEISEVIVVEGRDDEINLKRFFKCEVIRTNGFGVSKETYEKIKLASKNKGVIILTDPDHAGETIRKRISEVVKDVKHAFINREDAIKGDDIGIENASKEAANRRECLGELLGIGYCNGKQILKRLNNYGITKEEFFKAIKEIEKKYE